VDIVQLPHVLLQIEVPAKTFRANLALERLLIIVGVHVERQIIDLMESLVTDRAFVGLLARVCQLVILVVPLLMEALSAVLTNIGLKSIVNPRVGVEG
jgi:hypothetical protein